MAARGFAGGARRLARVAALGAASISVTVWAQSDKPLNLHAPPEAATAGTALCPVCGEIRSIREVHVGRRAPVQSGAPVEHIGSQPGTDDWRVVGTVAYLTWGTEKSDEGWRVGAVGTPEMQSQLGETSYEITVAMDSGERRSIQRRDGLRFRVGQRVTLRSGELETVFP
jgi:outer membrane lipoprotein SlyB